METRVENSGLDVISKQEIDSKMPDEIAGGIIEPASVTIKKEIIDTTELNPSVPDFENFIGNNDPINIKSEDIHTIIDNSHEEETYQHMMIGAEIMSEDESEEKTLHLKGEVIDMELENVKEEPDEKYSESSEDESRPNTSENNNNELGYHVNKLWRIQTLGLPGNEIKRFACNTCDYQSNLRSYVKKHLRVHSEALYQCDKCPFKTRHKYYLVDHLKYVHAHPAARKYSCQSCDYTTLRKSSLKIHSINHTEFASEKKPKVEWYKCELCSFKARRRFFLESHMNIHKPSGEALVFQCTLCPYTSRFKHGVNNHMTVHKKSSETTIYECELCTYKAKWPHCLRNHLKTHKKEQLPVHKCQHCDFQANNKYSVATHKKSAHREMYAKPKKEYKCDVCKYMGKSASRLSKHKLIHDDKRPFTCALCGAQTKLKKTLKNHILTMHGFLERLTSSTK